MQRSEKRRREIRKGGRLRVRRWREKKEVEDSQEVKKASKRRYEVERVERLK